MIVTQADCVNLLVRYYKEARHGIYLSNEEEEEARAKRNDSSTSQAIEKSSMKNQVHHHHRLVALSFHSTLTSLSLPRGGARNLG